jgi:dUTPase
MANSVGVIDAGYRGEIMVPLVKINPAALDLQLQEHRTLIQLILFPATLGPGNIKMRLVDDFDHHTSRGDGGFGSTDQ